MRYREPEFLPWDGRRVPMTFVAGYLGAGKTTLINELLARAERPIAVLVNDVGEVNIDHRLIKRRSGDTIELTDGCVCCSLNEGFGVALDQLRSRPQAPDQVVVELSGVADPERVVPWARSAGFVLDGTVTVVDVDQFLDRLEQPSAGHTVRTQVEGADLLVLTKLDLVDRPTRVTEVRSRLGDLAPGVPVVSTAGVLAGAPLIELGGRRPGGVTSTGPPSLFDAHRVATHPLPHPIEVEEVHAVLDALPASVVRVKGIAADRAGTRWLVQVVGRRRSVTELPAAETEEPTGLIVISVGE